MEAVAPIRGVLNELRRIRFLKSAMKAVIALLDTALAEGQGPGVIADRVAAAVLPDGGLRQELLETLDVDRRLARLAGALDALVRELSGGRG